MNEAVALGIAEVGRNEPRGEELLSSNFENEHIKIMETYRSGRNEPHSKCGRPKGRKGSNPFVSAKQKTAIKYGCLLIVRIEMMGFERAEKQTIQ